MKKYLLLILLALWSFTMYSQDLTLRPDTVIRGQETFFCWSQPKAKAIAKKLIRLSYCDSIIVVQAEEISILNSITINQDSIIKAQNAQEENMLKIVAMQDSQIEKLNETIRQNNFEIKKQKRLKWVGLVAGALSLFMIVK